MFYFEYLEITHNCWTNKRKELFGIVFCAQQCLLHEITVTLCGILLLLNVHTTVEPIQTRVLSIVCVYNNHISHIKYLPDYQGDNYSPKQTPLLKRRIQSYLGYLRCVYVQRWWLSHQITFFSQATVTPKRGKTSLTNKTHNLVSYLTLHLCTTLATFP